MLILDTDHMSLLEWDSNSAAHLRERLSEHNESDVATTVINYEEQVRGWMAYIAKARSIDAQVEAYRRLRNHLDNYRQIPVLDFDSAAAEVYQRLRRAKIRVGAMDLKIAAIAMATSATLLSRNRRDFQQIPDLKCEDWSV
jgi:tRNA(fMet)-specific endonuclease VapC